MTESNPDPKPPGPEESKPAPPTPAVTAASAPRRRWKRVLAWAGGALAALSIVVFFAGPPVISSIVRGRLVDEIQSRMNGTAELASFSFAWSGRMSMEGFVLRDAQGDVILSARRVGLDVALLSAIGGHYEVDVEVDEPVIAVRQRSDGTLNVAALMKGGGSAPGGGDGGSRGTGGSDALPSVRASVQINQGRLSIINADGGRTEFTELTARVSVPALDGTTTFEALAAGAGAVRLKGEAVLARDGRIAPETVTASATIALDRLDLANLSAVASLAAPETHLEGEVDGRLELRYGSEGARVSGRVAAAGVRVATERMGVEPLVVAAASFVPTVTLDREGTGRIEIDAEGEALARLRIALDAERVFSELGRVRGPVTLESDLRGALATLRPLLPIKPGVQFEGRASLAVTVEVETGRGGLGPVAASVDGRIEGFVGRDADGRALPVDPTMTLAVRSRWDPKGRLDVEHAELRAGGVAFDARGGVDLVAGTISDSRITASADLNHLAEKAAAFLDLPFQFGGRLDLSADVQGDGRTATASSRIEARAVFVDFGDGRRAGPLDVTLVQAGSLDLREGGRSTLDRFELRSAILDVDATGEGTGVLRADAVAANAGFALRLRPGALSERLRGMTGGYSASGHEVEASGRLALKGKIAGVVLDASGSAVRLTGPGMGADGATVERLTVRLEGAADLASLDGELKALRVGAGVLRVTPPGATTPVHLESSRIALAAARRGSTLEVSEFTLESVAANGVGRATIGDLGSAIPAISGTLEFRGDAGPVVDLAKVFAPALRNVGGGGAWSVQASAEPAGEAVRWSVVATSPSLTVRGLPAGPEPFDLVDANVQLRLKGMLAPSAGTLAVEDLRFEAPAVRGSGSGLVEGLAGSGAVHGAGRLELVADLAEVTARYGKVLRGWSLAGPSLVAQLEGAFEGPRGRAKGRLAGPRVDLTLPATPGAAARTLIQEEVGVAFDLAFDAAGERPLLRLEDAALSSRTGQLKGKGTIALGSPMSVDLEVRGDAELERVTADLSSAWPLPEGMRLAGTAAIDAVARGDWPRIQVTGEASAERWILSVPGQSPGATSTVEEPRVGLKFDAVIDSEAMDARIANVELTSELASGSARGTIRSMTSEPTFEGLEGRFEYVPDRLAVPLKPWLMGGTLAGAGRETAAFRLDGRAKDLDPIALLRGSRGTATLGIGTFTMTGLSASGGAQFTLEAEHARTTTLLDVNSGKADVVLDADLRDTPAALSTLRVGMKSVGTNAQMAPLLTYVHPIFAKAADAVDGVIEGKLDASLDLTLKGPLTTDLLTGGWTAFPKQRIGGTGHLELGQFGVKGLGFVKMLAELMDIDLPEGLELNPLDFTIRDGRLSYDRPMKMKLSGQVTTWTGSVGLDQTLDLLWEIPVTERLVKKHDFLRFWEGGTIKVPVKGTATSPHVMWKDVLADLAKQAASKALERQGSKEEEAAQLLAEADRLWDAGKPEEARPIYRKLADDFDKTLIYALHRKRIRDRR